MRRSTLVAATVIFLGGILTPRTTAFAHGRLESSTPAAGSTLATAPSELRLKFTEIPELVFTTLRLVGPSGDSVVLGPIHYSPDSRRAIVAAIRNPLAAGKYTVMWQMAGPDGHPIRDRFVFTLSVAATVLPAPSALTPGISPVPAPGRDAPPEAHHSAVNMPQGADFGVESPLFVFVRWLQFAGLVLVIGAVAFRGLVLEFLRRKQDPDSPMLADAARGAARVAHAAAGVLLLSLVMRLLAQSYAMHGPNDYLIPGRLGMMMRDTLWGWGWLIQAFGIALAGIGFHRAKDGKSGWRLAALGALILAFTPGMAGHASSVPRFRLLAQLADGVHIMGASGWLGSLFMVVAAGLPAAMRLDSHHRGRAIADLVNAFSPTALVFAGVVASTGVFAAWLHLGQAQALWQTQYGKTLLLKLGILSIVAATGAYNWLVVKPRLGKVEGGAKIRRSAMVELAVGVLVIAVTSVLVATPTAMDMQPMND